MGSASVVAGCYQFAVEKLVNQSVSKRPWAYPLHARVTTDLNL